MDLADPGFATFLAPHFSCLKPIGNDANAIHQKDWLAIMADIPLIAHQSDEFLDEAAI